jgi:hypothetical protein
LPIDNCKKAGNAWGKGVCEKKIRRRLWTVPTPLQWRGKQQNGYLAMTFCRPDFLHVFLSFFGFLSIVFLILENMIE